MHAFVHEQPAVLAQRYRKPLQRAGSWPPYDDALVVEYAAVTRAIVALAGAVDCATQVGANGRHTPERVALADEKNPLFFQERHRTVPDSPRACQL